MQTKDFKAGLIESIKVAGQMIIDNAEDIAGKTERMSYLDICVNFDPENGSIPELSIYRSHLPSYEQLQHINDAFNGESVHSDKTANMPNSDKTCFITAAYDLVANTTAFKCSACGTVHECNGHVRYHARFDTGRCPDCGARISNEGLLYGEGERK